MTGPHGALQGQPVTGSGRLAAVGLVVHGAHRPERRVDGRRRAAGRDGGRRVVRGAVGGQPPEGQRPSTDMETPFWTHQCHDHRRDLER